MMEPLFHIGDMVTVRKWDDMERQYGVDEFGDIRVPLVFVTDMMYLCGNTYKVYEVRVRNDYGLNGVYQYLLCEQNGERIPWDISEEMLERPAPFEGDDCKIDIAQLLDLFD
jgi:signal peptidase I